jgi:hypothetical protein
MSMVASEMTPPYLKSSGIYGCLLVVVLFGSRRREASIILAAARHAAPKKGFVVACIRRRRPGVMVGLVGAAVIVLRAS